MLFCLYRYPIHPASNTLISAFQTDFLVFLVQSMRNRNRASLCPQLDAFHWTQVFNSRIHLGQNLQFGI